MEKIDLDKEDSKAINWRCRIARVFCSENPLDRECVALV